MDIQEAIEKLRHAVGWLEYMTDDDFKDREIEKIVKMAKELDDIVIKVCDREGI